MSIEFWQFPKSARKSDLVACLRGFGFVTCKNPFWPGPPGTVSAFWSEPEDFKSTSGIDASVFPLDDEAKKTWETSADWGLRTRTSIWATTFDQETQNQVARRVRRVYGGYFYNDAAGRCRYTAVHQRTSTPASRGIYGVLARIQSELRNLEYALPKEEISSLATPKGVITPENDEAGILKIVKQADPARVLYNALIPFLVACLEHFFRDSFEILLRYDRAALKRLEGQNRKISLAEVLDIRRGDLALERVVSGWYSFQNIEGISKAFDDVLGINVWRFLRRRKRVRDRLPVMHSFLDGLISSRHGVIHHFEFDRNLDRATFLTLLEGTAALIQLAVAEIEKRLGVPIGPG
jgi:hypothetical protein